MLKVLALIVLTCGVVAAQNTNSPTTQRPRTTNTNRSQTPTEAPAKPAPPKTAAAATAPGSEGVLAAFNTLLDGIRHANVDEVM
ncbi:MAG TPA: hypothetical protein VK868_12160, partial [Pyrinomonadaceae bacterium]|nr:hypothetical protein [Pyrinomonadaceae bacterium]